MKKTALDRGMCVNRDKKRVTTKTISYSIYSRSGMGADKFETER